MRGAALEALGVPVDVNRASLLELESLPGIGPVLARRIADARPFDRVDDLRRVAGIGHVRMLALRRRAYVSAANVADRVAARADRVADHPP
ncbi:MAG: helix-hairpin-helix domain-containing protein [Nannocystis sp.]|nr:helix-hairpin-helix domain-containing protein [Nannocystis sp.]